MKSAILNIDNDDTLNVVTLGASQTLGYGFPGYLDEKFAAWTGTASELEDWETNGWNAKTWNPLKWKYQSLTTSGDSGFGLDKVIPGAFPYLLEKALEDEGYVVNLSQLAAASMRVNDLYALLCDDYVGDAYYSYFFDNLYNAYGSTIEQGQEVLKDKYRTALKEADIITFDLGAGNVQNALCDYYGTDDPYVVYKEILSNEDYEAFVNFRKAIKSRIDVFIEKEIIDSESVDFYEDLLDRCAYNLLGFCSYFDKTMEWIYTYNPDVTLVVMEIQNICPECLYYFDGIELYTNDITQILIDIANNYTASFSKYSDRYYYSGNTSGVRYTCIVDDIRAYFDSEDLTPELKEFCDLYRYTSKDPTAKVVFTSIYENAGGTVHDGSYEYYLNNAYDAYIKFIQYIDAADYSAEDKSNYDALNSIVSELLADSYYEYKESGSNDVALEQSIEAYENLPLPVKRGIKYTVCCVYNVLLHPNKKGYEEMTSDVLDTLEFGEKGISAIPARAKTGIANFIKTVKKLGSYVLDYSKQLVNEYIENEAKAYIETKVQETINTISNTIKNTINRQIGNIIGIINMMK